MLVRFAFYLRLSVSWTRAGFFVFNIHLSRRQTGVELATGQLEIKYKFLTYIIALTGE
jgi:hypothetical protein